MNHNLISLIAGAVLITSCGSEKEKTVLVQDPDQQKQISLLEQKEKDNQKTVAELNAAIAELESDENISREEADKLASEAVAKALEGSMTLEEAQKKTARAVVDATKGMISQEDANKLVAEAVAKAIIGKISREDADQLVADAVAAAVAGMITKDEANQLVSDAVAEAVAGMISKEDAGRLVAEAVEKALDGAVSEEDADKRVADAVELAIAGLISQEDADKLVAEAVEKALDGAVSQEELEKTIAEVRASFTTGKQREAAAAFTVALDSIQAYDDLDGSGRSLTAMDYQVSFDAARPCELSLQESYPSLDWTYTYSLNLDETFRLNRVIFTDRVSMQISVSGHRAVIPFDANIEGETGSDMTKVVEIATLKNDIDELDKLEDQLKILIHECSAQ